MRKALVLVMLAVSIASCNVSEDVMGGGGLAVNPLVPEGFYMPVFLSPGPSSRGVVIEGTVDDDGTLVEDKAEQDSVLAFYMWFTPMIGDFLPRSSVNGNSDKYTLFGEKVNYTTYESKVGGFCAKS